MAVAAAPPPPAVIEGLKCIAAWLSDEWRVDVSLFQVWRAIRLNTDPLPAYRRIGRWYCDAAALRAWAARPHGKVVGAHAAGTE